MDLEASHSVLSYYQSHKSQIIKTKAIEMILSKTVTTYWTASDTCHEPELNVAPYTSSALIVAMTKWNKLLLHPFYRWQDEGTKQVLN